jgi:hypothetical protein
MKSFSVFLIEFETFECVSTAAPEAWMGNVIKLFLNVGGMPARHSLSLLKYRPGKGQITAL